MNVFMSHVSTALVFSHCDVPTNFKNKTCCRLVYRFDVHWLKDKKHWTLEGVRSDNNLTREEMKVLEGIHKRHRSFKVDGPSKMDLEFLQEYYGNLMMTLEHA